MCFSPEADLFAGVVIGVAAIDGLSHVHRRDNIALATLPVIFAVHQLDEVFVWWGLRGQVSERILHLTMNIYLVIAFTILPILAPLAVALREHGRRRRYIYGFVALGALVAAVLTRALVTGPANAEIVGHHISYVVEMSAGVLWVALYIVATCGSFVVSSHRHIQIFGWINLVVVVALVLVQRSALISLWCAWAAVASIALALHFRNERRISDTGDPALIGS